MASIPPRKPRSWETKKPPQAGRNFVNPWYHTTAWRALRAAHLRDNPLCVECREYGRLTQATVVDHKKPVSFGRNEQERETLMWDVNNHQSMCASCHNKKSAKEKFNK